MAEGGRHRSDQVWLEDSGVADSEFSHGKRFSQVEVTSEFLGQ